MDLVIVLVKLTNRPLLVEFYGTVILRWRKGNILFIKVSRHCHVGLLGDIITQTFEIRLILLYDLAGVTTSVSFFFLMVPLPLP